MKRYIEVTSTHRNRSNWPCPAEFVIPLSCSNKNNEALESEDPIINGYPQFSWYQLPYANQKWNTTYPVQKPRSINDTFYTSLWPICMDQDITFNPPLNITKTGWITAMKFSGGTHHKPLLNSIVISPKNIWNPINGNKTLNRYYTPIDNYFVGAMIFKFKEDPSCYLNSWNKSQTITITPSITVSIGDEFVQSANVKGNIICIKNANTFVVTLQENMNNFVNGSIQHTPSVTQVTIVNVNKTSESFNYTGNVESSIITSYDSCTGEIELKNAFNDDTNMTKSYFLIDFNTDPKNDWGNFVTGGPRVFIPNGSNLPQSYEGMTIQNYTLSNQDSSFDYDSKVIDYNFERKLIKFNEPIEISETHDTFVLKHKRSLKSKMAEKMSICTGSILKLKIKEAGTGYEAGQTIGTLFNNYYDNPNSPYSYTTPDYILNTTSGTGFRGIITAINENGGIIDIQTLQQGCGYKPQKNIHLTSLSGGKNGIFQIENTYQTIEIAKNNDEDELYNNLEGNYLFLPNYNIIDMDGNIRNEKPILPRYKKFTNTLDIRISDYPVKTCDNKLHTSNVYQILHSFTKTISFGNWWETASNLQSSVNVLYMNDNINIIDTGLTDSNDTIYVPNALLPKNGFIQQQELEYLSFSLNNFNHLNFTGTRIGRSQAGCHQIKLISLILPNIPLDTNTGGLISCYPYIYVELRSVNNYSKGVLYSNNPNANRALFRVTIRDTSTPFKSKFIKLRGSGSVQTVNFTPNDDLYFKVYLSNGDLFKTIQKDTASPLSPDFFVQISAQFEFVTIR